MQTTTPDPDHAVAQQSTRLKRHQPNSGSLLRVQPGAQIQRGRITILLALVRSNQIDYGTTRYALD